ncbi:uncharacterized protein LOC142980600 [Anticarsia gemmatalis]|uniref:uncharacterized protein LOC142980600 n=1 Tax=Anticarsia gemmatalis TaxID=129554 RepID=UPI003F75EA18
MFNIAMILFCLPSFVQGGTNERKIFFKNLTWSQDYGRPVTELTGVQDLEPGTNFNLFFEDTHFNSFKCRSFYYGTEFETELVDKGIYSELKINNVTDDMSDVWICEINEKNVDKLIRFKVRVVGAKPTQMILVNDVVLPTRRVASDTKREPTRHIAEYQYNEGERVEVACLNPYASYCTLYMNYEYANSLDEMFQNISNYARISVNTKLLRTHNDTEMLCSCRCSQAHLNTDLELKFILKRKHDIITLTINDNIIIRGTRMNRGNNTAIYYKLAYSVKNATLKVNFKIYQDSVDLTDLPEATLKTENNTSLNLRFNQTEKLKNEKIIILAVSSHFSESTHVVEEVQLGFTDINAYYLTNHGELIMLGIPQGNVSVEMHENYGNKYIYYEYYNGEQLKLTCKALTIGELKFEGKVTMRDNITIIYNLRKKHHKTKVICSLRSIALEQGTLRMKTFGQIHVMFSFKDTKYNKIDFLTTTTEISLPTSRSIGSDEEIVQHFQFWIPLLVGILLLIMTISIVVVCSRKRQKRCQQSAPVETCATRHVLDMQEIPLYEYPNCDSFRAEHDEHVYDLPVVNRKQNEPQPPYIYDYADPRG